MQSRPRVGRQREGCNQECNKREREGRLALLVRHIISVLPPSVSARSLIGHGFALFTEKVSLLIVNVRFTHGTVVNIVLKSVGFMWSEWDVKILTRSRSLA